MKILLLLVFLSLSLMTKAQLTTDSLRKFVRDSNLGSYSYHEQFIGHKGYGAPYILTSDGGGAAFGDFEENEKRFGLLIRLGKDGKEIWRKEIKPEYDELECQSVVEDADGNLYAFMLSYNYKKYRGGAERIVCYDKSGKLLWDKTIGNYSVEKNPTVSYIHFEEDVLALRGHIAIEKPESGKDPQYYYWEGWLDVAGALEQKASKPIDWAKDKWQDWYKPEE